MRLLPALIASTLLACTTWQALAGERTSPFDPDLSSDPNEATDGDAPAATPAPSPSPPSVSPANAPAAATATPAPSAPSEHPAAGVTTGSIDPNADPAHPLASIGRGAREALGPPGGDGSIAAAFAASETRRTSGKPPTPEEAGRFAERYDRLTVAEFYASHGDAPLWVTADGFNDRARAVMAEIGRADEWGLTASDFALPELRDVSAGTRPSEAELAKAELALSLAVLKYARYARGGAIAKPWRQLSSYYDRVPQLRARNLVLSEIASAAAPAAYLVSLHPKNPQFELLRQAWLEARRTAKGKPARLAADLKPGESHDEVPVLRARMGLAAASGADQRLYDGALAQAVAGFQAYRGLQTTDGTVDAATRDALMKPIKGNALQLLANMQAWRYLPDEMGAEYVWVNVPEYLIRIVKSDEIIWTERITAGLVNKQTPIFSDKIERVTFKSRWRVPDSIKVKEVWPSLLSGGGMMRQHGLIILDKEGKEVDWTQVDWSKADMADYTLWQPPGPKNQLGIVKFSFPSKHYVFMHDTPDKYMFNWAKRANSHGCMRIRNPLDMATILLGADKGWDRAKVDDLVKSGPDHNIIEFDRHVPVHITYFTARVEAGGKIETWPDIYGHEKRIRQALAGDWARISVPPNHLAPLDQARLPVASATKRPQRQKGYDSVQSLMSAAFGAP